MSFSDEEIPSERQHIADASHTRPAVEDKSGSASCRSSGEEEAGLSENDDVAGYCSSSSSDGEILAGRISVADVPELSRYELSVLAFSLRCVTDSPVQTICSLASTSLMGSSWVSVSRFLCANPGLQSIRFTEALCGRS